MFLNLLFLHAVCFSSCATTVCQGRQTIFPQPQIESGEILWGLGQESAPWELVSLLIRTQTAQRASQGYSTEPSGAGPFTNGFLNDCLGPTRSSNEDTKNWAPRRWSWLLAGIERRKERKDKQNGAFWNISHGRCFPWGNPDNSCTNTQITAVCALYLVGSVPCWVPYSHAHGLCYPASPQLLLNDIPLPCSSSRDNVPGHSGQVPCWAVVQSFAVFEECRCWGSLTPFLKVLLVFQFVSWHCLALLKNQALLLIYEYVSIWVRWE